MSDETKATEERKLQSEIARNEAEQIKFISEAKEIDKRVASGIYRISPILKTIIAGIVAAILFTAWAIGFLKPLLEKEQLLLSIDNKILGKENEKNKQLLLQGRENLDILLKDYNNLLSEIEKENDALNLQISEAAIMTTGLKERLDLISKEYKKLSEENQASVSDKTRFIELANKASSESKDLDKELTNIDLNKKNIANRTESISKKLIPSMLIANSWTLKHLGLKKEVKLKFETDGTLTSDDPKDPSKYTWSFTSGVLTFKIGIVTYVATVSDSKTNTIKGKASSNIGKSFNWSMVKI
ncbi:MAG: hypothetical protein GQ564_23665 [Bacteroidales bacterium]|nr:hypothetical protein [Bacteroidales bacterium]